MAKSDKAQVDREVQRLDNWTADAIANLFGGEDTSAQDLVSRIKSKGVIVLDIDEDRICMIPGEFFVDWVWELLANA